MSDALWTVGVYEKAIRGRVNHERYVVLADSEESAVAAVRTEHEHEAVALHRDARYVAEETGIVTKVRPLKSMSAKMADKYIAAKLT